MTTSKYRRACDACQKRHLKCNFANPCLPCSEAGRACIEAKKYQFRNNEDPEWKSGTRKRPTGFPRDQLWATVPKKLEYIFEPKCDEDGNVVFDSNDDPVQNEGSSPKQITFLPSIRHDPHDPIDQPLDSRPTLKEDTTSSFSTPFITTESCRFHVAPLNPLWPVSTKEEAILLRHFSIELSIWFDFLDKGRHFSTVVVHAAATSPALYFAILAVSSKHLSITQEFDRHKPDKYQLECLKVLIPALSNPNALLDENLFAATIILRLFDEMTGICPRTPTFI